MSVNKILMVYASAGTPTGQNSKSLAALFQSLGVTSDGTDQGLTISSVGGNFDFNGKSLSNFGAMVAALAMGGNKVTGLAAGTTSGDAVEYAQFLAGLAATGTSAEWQNSVLTATILDPSTISGSPTAGDRYLISGTGVGGWSGKDNQIAQYVSGPKATTGSWTYTVPTTGTFTDADDQTGLLYYFGGSSWVTKSFEATTASGFLSKSGFDIQLTALANGKIILGNGSGVATAVTPSGDVTMSNSGVNTIAAGAVTAAKLATVTDGTTLDQSGAGGTLEIKALGVGTGQIAAAAVTETKIASSALASGGGLAGGSGTTLSFDDTETFTNSSGSDIAANTVVVIKSDGTIAAADATVSGINQQDLGVAAAIITNTSSGKVHVRHGGAPVTVGSGLTIGTMYFVDPATPGAVTSTPRSNSGDNHYSVGRASSSTKVRLAPRFVIVFA